MVPALCPQSASRVDTTSDVCPGLVCGRRDRGTMGLEAAIPVSAEQALEVLPVDPVSSGRRGDGHLLGDHLEDGHLTVFDSL